MNKRKHKEKHLRSLILILIAIVIFFMAINTSPKQNNMPDADVHLLITMRGWTPDHFEAKVNAPVKIHLMTLAEEANHPDNVHSFVLNETGTEVYVNAGESAFFTITFSKPGVYTFWCITCCGGVLSSNMAGTVLVA